MLQDQGLLDFKPERLALTGYRCSMAAYEHGDPSCWDELWSIYVQDGSLDFACRVMGSLQYFVRSLRAAPPASLNYYPRNCRRVCQRECLVLSLISALQHGAPAETDYVLGHLLGEAAPDQSGQVVAAASSYATVLRGEGQVLLPVPLNVIQSIMEQTTCKATCPFKLH